MNAEADWEEREGGEREREREGEAAELAVYYFSAAKIFGAACE